MDDRPLPGVKCLAHVSRDAATVRHVVAVGLGPRPNLGCRSATLDRSLTPGSLAALAGHRDVVLKQSTESVVASEVAIIGALNTQIDRLGAVTAEHFGRHRDAEIYASLRGLGAILGARVLGEFGDAPGQYVDAKARKNYAGTSPITRASGTKKVVLARYARNRRLGDALQQWAFCSMRGSPGARAYYQQLRARNIGHQAALRQLANRLVGILHGCLKTHTVYDEQTAWGHILAATG